MNSNVETLETKHRAAKRHSGQILGATALAAVIAVTGQSLVSAAPAQAAPEYGCTGFDYHCDQSGYAEHAETSFWNMAPGHNCTNYVAYRLIQDGMPQQTDWLHNGGDWADDARAHTVPVDDVPAVGAVAQWTSGAGGVSAAGHVAYVEQVGDGWIIVAEDNYSAGPMSTRKIQVGDPEWPSNFIHFPRPRSVTATTIYTEAWIRQTLPAVFK